MIQPDVPRDNLYPHADYVAQFEAAAEGLLATSRTVGSITGTMSAVELLNAANACTHHENRGFHLLRLTDDAGMLEAEAAGDSATDYGRVADAISDLVVATRLDSFEARSYDDTPLIRTLRPALTILDAAHAKYKSIKYELDDRAEVLDPSELYEFMSTESTNRLVRLDLRMIVHLWALEQFEAADVLEDTDASLAYSQVVASAIDRSQLHRKIQQRRSRRTD